MPPVTVTHVAFYSKPQYIHPMEYHPTNIAEWRAWLKVNQKKEKNVWLVLQKKSSPGPGIAYVEAVEEALCFGWIDSKPAKRDENTYLLFFASRKKGAVWSRINKERIKRLIRDRRMTPAGLQKIKEAKLDGSWSTLDRVEALEMPAALEKALAKSKKAIRNFEAFPAGIKKQLYYWVISARRDETGVARIREIVSRAAKNERANQWKRK